MNRNFITDLTHFLDENGDVPADLPAHAKELVENLGSIVADVSKHPRFTYQKTDIQCWSMSHNDHCCIGIIEAAIDIDNDFNIVWYCPECNDNGVISNWENSCYDQSDKKN